MGLYRGSGVRIPPVPVVLSVCQRGSLLDGLAMYLSCDTKKFHDNESTQILHSFPLPPWRRHCRVVTSQSLRSRYDRHFVGITRHDAVS